MSDLRLLVTGFGPFPGMPRNPSADAVRALARYGAAFARHGISLTTQILPVHYEACTTFAPDPAPDVVVHVGVAGRRPCVTIETRASQRRSPRAPDATGRIPHSLLNGPDAMRPIDTGWNVHALVENLRQAGVPAMPSRDAGGYVCNALLYRSLAPQSPPAIFIHVPRAEVCAPSQIARALARVLPATVAALGRRMGRRTGRPATRSAA